MSKLNLENIQIKFYYLISPDDNISKSLKNSILNNVISIGFILKVRVVKFEMELCTVFYYGTRTLCTFSSNDDQVSVSQTVTRQLLQFCFL